MMRGILLMEIMEGVTVPDLWDTSSNMMRGIIMIEGIE
jgi:hypothetical protein